MKRNLKKKIWLFALCAIFLPGSVFAVTSENDFWAKNYFLYHFSIQRQADGFSVAYEINSGDESVDSGDWAMLLFGPHDQLLSRSYFSFSSDTAVVDARYQPNGTTVKILDPQGSTVAVASLAGSRVCDEDGACESQYGEVSNNCPADCSSGYAGIGQEADIQLHAGIGKRVGAALMGLALAAAGLLIVRGIGGMLDRRHQAYDNRRTEDERFN